MAVRNLYKVPVKEWRKWNAAEKQLFNSTYSHMYKNYDFYTHPNQEKPKHFHWKVLAWNAAWMAADHLKDQRKEAQ